MTRNHVRLLLVSIVVLALLQTGCGKFFSDSNGGGGGGGNSTTTFVYAASSSGVFAYKADLTSGTLTTLSGSPFTAGPTPAAMVIDPKNHFLYVGTSSGISGFAINSDGTLNTISLGGNTQGLTPVALAASASALHLLDNSFNELTTFTINSDGTLSGPITTGTIQVAGVPSGLVIDAAGQHLYAALGASGILTVNINSDGSLTANTGNIVTPSSNAVAFSDLAITPNGKSMYATANGGVVGFSFNSNGIPTPLSSGSVVATGTNPGAAAIDANSSFLYVTNRGSDNVASFSITNSGLITPITNSPFATASAPVGVTVSSNSNFVFVANSQGVQTFAVDSSTPGKLNAKATVNAGNNPAAIVSLH
jgi:6-phosphogluconolactonase